MYLVLVPVRMALPGWPRRGVPAGEIGHGRVFGQAVGYIDAEAVNAAVEPEAQDRLELGSHLGVRPVKIGLLGGEEVQIPLLGRVVSRRDSRPRRPAKVAEPVIGRLVAAWATASTEDVARSLGPTRRSRTRGTEPRVIARGVIGDQVDDDP